MRREETGLVAGLLGEGRFLLPALMAATLYILMAFPWKSACLHCFTLVSTHLFKQS